jgi:hypothetical protein
MDRRFAWTRELLMEWDPPAHAVTKFMRQAVSHGYYAPWTDNGEVAWRRLMLRSVEASPQGHGLTLAQADRFLFWWTMAGPIRIEYEDELAVVDSMLDALERLVKDPAQWFHPHGFAKQMMWCNLLYGFTDIEMKGRPANLVAALDAAIVGTVRRLLQLDDLIAVDAALHGLSVLGTDRAKNALRKFADTYENKAFAAIAAQGIDRKLCFVPSPDFVRTEDHGDWEELPECRDLDPE